MVEYIDREALLDRLEYLIREMDLDLNDDFDDGFRIGLERAMHEIELRPAADVRPVPEGGIGYSAAGAARGGDMMSNDYINRYEVLNVIDDAIANNALSYEGCVNQIMEFIAKIPAADVQPVVRGKWIDHQKGRWIYAKCSECGTVNDVKSNFCPNCGADMRPEPPKEKT